MVAPMSLGARAVDRCDRLGVAPFSDTADGLFRAYLSPGYIASQRQVSDWMRDAGMAVSIDPAGNLIGRYAGMRDTPPLILGSHLDSVRDAGRYDGPLGIMLAIECVAALDAAGRRLPFPIEVYAFGDEEGSRFPMAMLTSRAVADTLAEVPSDIVDADGVTLADALHRYRAEMGLDAADMRAARHGPALAYVEAHIEQGPMLEAKGLSVATVTGIAAQKRYAVRVTGRAGHAGTTAMTLRRDALAAASEMILAVEATARAAGPDRVATVGTLSVAPGAANVIPGAVHFTLDVRASNNSDCDALADEILARLLIISRDRNVNWDSGQHHVLPASPCDSGLMDVMDAAIESEGLPVHRLMSGAGHDAMILSALCPTAMLFIRCGDGISHNPAESVKAADCDAALRVLSRFIDRLGDIHAD